MNGEQKIKTQIYNTNIQKGMKWQGHAEERNILSSST